MKIRCKAILFDMDGTLVDSTRVVEHTWSQWAARHGLPLDAVLRFSHGRPSEATLAHFLPGQDHTEELAVLNHTEETDLEGVRAIPGADAFVRAAMQGPWAVVTSAWRTLAEVRIRAAGLPLPAVMVPFDEIEHGKPHPEGYLKAAAELGVPPQDCLVFEDTRPGIDAGLQAGMQVIGLLTTLPSDQLAYDKLIRDFRDLRITWNGSWFDIETVTNP